MCIRLILLFAVSAFAALCAVSLSKADGVVRDGLGATSSGRGGTNIAHADNGVILLDNPAAMVNLPGWGLAEIGIDTLFTDLHYSDPDNSTSEEFRPFPMGHLAYIAKSRDGIWAFGIGAFAPAGFGVEWELNGPAPFTGEREYSSLGALIKVLPGIAVRLTDELSIGGTLGVAASHMELEGPYFLQSFPFTGMPTLMDLKATGAALCWSCGLQYQLSEYTVVGVTYTSESSFDLEGDASAVVHGLGESDFDATVELEWPRSIGLGIAHGAVGRSRISADVIWYDWSTSFDNVDVQLTHPSNDDFETVIGSRISERFPLRWHDSVSVRVGYEQFITPRHVARIGYAYHSNQIPDRTLTPFIPAILEHAVTVGYGTCWSGRKFDMGYQYSFGRDRDVTNSGIAGGDFDSSKLEAQAHWLFFSWTQQF